MNLIQLSNLFNLICLQMSDIKGYHMGWVSEIYNGRSVQNNWNPANSLGIQYPFVLFEVPELRTALMVKGVVKTYADCRLNLFALLNYKNDASTNTMQGIEQREALRMLAVRFFQNLRQQSLTNLGFSILGEVSMEFEPPDNKANLIHLACVLKIEWIEDCTTDTAPNFSPASVIPPYAYPPSTTDDYEKFNVTT